MPGVLPAVGAAFFVSGISALVYQIAWQRILALHSGVGIYSIALIVAAFMAGLGAGSHLGGVLSARVRRASALRIFAVLELGIAAFGAASSWIYYDWLYVRAGWLYAPPWRAALLHLASFLIPTGLMGMSLPFLVRAMVGDVAGAGRTIGFLYGINMLGASAGAWLTPWVLIRYFGIRGAIGIAALGNLVAGLTALALYGWLRSGAANGDEPSAPSAGSTAFSAPSAPTRSLVVWIVLYALSGFCALALEIVWFRLIDVAVKSRAYTFGTVLAIYLLGAAAGSLAGAAAVPRIRRPRRAFLPCQCLLLAYAGSVLLLLAYLPPQTRLYHWFFEYWRRYDGFSLGQNGDLLSLTRLYVLLPCLLYAVPTVLMGLSFPILQRAVQDDPRTAGHKVGVLQAANIAGSVAGGGVAAQLQREGPGRPAVLRGPHAARRRARDPARRAAGRGHHRPRHRGYGVGGGLPAGDRQRHRLRDLWPATPAAGRVPRARALPAARRLPARPARTHRGGGWPERAGPLVAAVRPHRGGSDLPRPGVQREPVLGGILQPLRPQAQARR